MTKVLRSIDQFLAQWLTMAAAFLVMGVAVTYQLVQDRQNVEAREQDRLLAATRVIQVNVEANLASISDTLAVLVADIREETPDRGFDRRLKILVDAMPAVLSVSVLDAAGTIVASNQPDLLGIDASQRDYFTTPRANPDPQVLFVSPPFPAATGQFSLNVTKARLDGQGRFAGVITATLDPAYFGPLLESVRYSPDMVASLHHGDGLVFLLLPPGRREIVGQTLAAPGSMFLKHKESGKSATVFTGRVLATGDDRMLAQRDIDPPQLKMDKKLGVAASRLTGDIYASWRSNAMFTGGILLLSTAFIAFILLRYQAGQKVFLANQAKAARDLADSELRLRRAELNSRSGNWELHLDTQSIVASEGAAKLYGLERTQLDFATIKSMALPKYRPLLNGTLERLLRSGRPYEAEFQIRTGDTGEIRDLRSLATLDKARRVVFGVIQDITERNRAAQALVESERRFRDVFENNGSVILLVDPQDGAIINANRAAREFYGFARLAGMNIGEINMLAPAELQREIADAVSQKRDCFLFRHRLANAEIRDVEVYSTPTDVGGKTLLFSVVHDITERRKLERHQQLAASVFTHAREGIMITDAAGTIIDVNAAFTTITGYSRYEAVDRTPAILKSGLQQAGFYAAMWRRLVDDGFWSGEIWNRRKSGEVYAEMLSIAAVQDDDGAVRNYVGMFTDITALMEHQAQLEHAAHYDALTGLPNRMLLADRLRHAISQSRRHRNSVAVAYFDLDGFKAVNDTYGHDRGDRLLMTIAQRLKETLREGDTLARIGGDEFVVVLVDLATEQDCVPILQRLLEAAASPVDIGEAAVQVSASIGLTCHPRDPADPDLLLRHADQAMYEAKRAGRNRYHVFDATAEADDAVTPAPPGG